MVILSNVENINFGLNEKDNNKSKCSESDNVQENPELISNRRVNSAPHVDEVSCLSSDPESDADDPDYTDKESGSETEVKKRNKGKTKRKSDDADLHNWKYSDSSCDEEDDGGNFIGFREGFRGFEEDEPTKSDADDFESDDEDANESDSDAKHYKKKNSQVSEYELRRKNNIAEFQNLYKEMFGTAPGPGPEIDLLNSSSWKVEKTKSEGRTRRRRNSSDPEFRTSAGRRLSLPLPRRRSARVTNSFYRSSGTGLWTSNLDPVEKLENIIRVRYNGDWPRNQKYSDSSCDEEDDGGNFIGFREGFRGFEEDEPTKKRKRSTHREWKPRIRAPRTIIPPEAISDAQIAKITYKSANKIYDNENGTTCHQCRQKTKDTKTICRSPNCAGVRGQFCGFCLKSRYGEDAAEALKNPTWECPPCRNICNCSICRTRQGKLPTGILKPQVMEKGYDSVYHFLKTLKESSEDEEL